MKRLVLIFVFTLAATYSYGSSLHDDIYREYPKENFIVGIGESKRTDNPLKDKRVAEVLARVDIARQIKVRVKEDTVDIMCEGKRLGFFNGKVECENQFVMVIETSVDEFLHDSNIVRYEERGERIYAVAVLKRRVKSEALQEKTNMALESARKNLEKAGKGNSRALKKAQEEYLKAFVYDKERAIVEGVRQRSSTLFDELAEEIIKLKSDTME